MVNKGPQKISTRALMLEELRRRSGGAVSGEMLGRILGVSRVAVWKQAQALRGAGYPVEGDDRGYRMGEEEGDFLFPWEFGERESLFRHWESTDSTMNRAAELAGKGAPEGTVITAETQTAGRGRNGRSWVSRRGGLFFTLLERPGTAAADYSRHSLEAHIALGRAVTALCGKEARLRWPNDVYAGGRKIAGLLTEFHAAGDRITWFASGIGVNVNNSPRGAANCAGLLGRALSRRALLLKFLEELRLVKEVPAGELRRMWNREAEGLGREALVLEGDEKTPEGRVLGRGTFLGIDGQGRGLVQTGDRGRPAVYVPGPFSLRFTDRFM